MFELSYGPPPDRSPAGTTAARYCRPASLGEAVDLLAADPWTVVAGCTVYYLNPANRPDRGWILDVTRIAGLERIDVAAAGARIGAAATWSAIAAAPLPAACRTLQEAAARVGSVQIRNAGTIGGNLVGAAATADGLPPLLVLEAVVELSSAAATRTLPVADFILGSRRTAKRPDELVSAVLIPLPDRRRFSAFLKLGVRSSLAPVVVSVAALIGLDAGGRIDEAAVAVGACSSVPRRLPSLERRLMGVAPTAMRLASVFDPDEDLALLTPAADVRVTAEYRLDAAATLVRRALARLGSESAAGGPMRGSW